MSRGYDYTKKIGNDPNYPYGNRLRKGHSIKSALKTAVPLSGIGATIGGMSSATAWIDDAGQKKTRDKLLHSGIGAGIGAAIGGATGATYGYKDGENRRYLSYLPSAEQVRLEQSLKKINSSYDKIRTRNESGKIDDDEACALYTLNIRKGEKLLLDASARGKALMLAEKKNRHFGKKASDYLDDAVMEKSAASKIQYVTMGKNSKGENCLRTIRLTRAEARKFKKDRQLPMGNLVINRRNKKVYLVDDYGKRTKKHIGIMTSEKVI